MRTNEPRSAVKRLLATALGLALVAALLEGGLWAARRWRAPHAPAPAPAASRDAPALTILCAGDSYVYGVGSSSPERAYPAQLQAILQQRRPERLVRVLNIGVRGHNTSETLAVLQRAVPPLAPPPELVVVTSGINNFWNLHLSTALEEGYATLPVSKRWLRRFEAAHVGKMAVILWQNTRSLATQLAARENWLNEEQKSVSLFDEKNPVEMHFVETWVKHDIAAIGRCVQSAGSRPVFTQYVGGETNEWVESAARENGFAVCPSPGHADIWEKAEQFAPDGWHLNDGGQAVYARKVADCLEPLLSSPAPPP
jgi:lysophospholipase L1-like esterase